jgi:hypothetical protein
MSFTLNVPEKDVLGKGKYKNPNGNTECAVFVQRATGAPNTALWRNGIKVKDAKAGDIPRGTAIATFDEKGRYPTDALGKHAAVYLSHNEVGITVLDQWNNQGEVLERVIRFNRPATTRRSNNGDTFSVIEVEGPQAVP